jgi:hypothetical protein
MGYLHVGAGRSVPTLCSGWLLVKGFAAMLA